jgi:hypothetical protein
MCINRALQERCIYRRQRGATPIVSLAVLTLMFLFASFALNAARFYNYKGRLHALAREVGGFAGGFLPNPQIAYERAKDAFEAFKGELARGGEALPEDLTLTVFQTSGAQEEREYDGAAAGVELPLHSMRFVIRGTFTPRLLLLDKTGSRHARLLVASSVRVQLAPTDVMLVVENSNSLLSPLENESDGDAVERLAAAFGMWNDELLGPDAPYGGRKRQLSKMIARARQCFGSSVKNVKRSALLLYDLLSSAGTFRVGVLPTLHTEGEFPGALIRLTPDGSDAAYRPERLNSPPHDPEFFPPSEEGPYGSFENEATRCAALTDIFPLPAHPLERAVNPAFSRETFRASVTSQLRCGGRMQSGCGELAHLAFDPEAELLPRELLWTLDAGRTFELGYPDPKYDYQNTPFAVQRAIDLLRAAPQRSDRQEVRRRVVLVLTDGFEQFAESDPGVNAAGDDRRFTRVAESAPGSGEFTWDIRSYDARPSGNFCALGAAAPEAVKLGVLWYGARPAPDSEDMYSRLLLLAGHDPDGAEVGKARSACNGSWSADAGSFLAESSPRTFPAAPDAAYFEQLAPRVARALFSAEVIE